MYDQVSIVIPVYNTSKYVGNCIDSVIAQTYNNLDIILVDDGSTDGSGIICDYYGKKDSRIRVFHKKNEGVSSARNLGLDHCNGKYVAFIDSDDVIHPQFIELLAGLIGDSDISECKIERVCTNDSKFEVIKKDECKFDYNNYRQRILSLLRNGGGVCGCLLIKEKVNQLRFNTDLKQAEDTLFLYNYVSMCRTCLKIHVPLYRYVQREQSAVSTIDYKGYSDRAEVEQFFYENETKSLLPTSSKEKRNTVALLSVKLMYKYKYLEKWDKYYRFKCITKKKILSILSLNFSYLSFKEKFYLIFELFLARRPNKHL